MSKIYTWFLTIFVSLLLVSGYTNYHYSKIVRSLGKLAELNLAITSEITKLEKSHTAIKLTGNYFSYSGKEKMRRKFITSSAQLLALHEKFESQLYELSNVIGGLREEDKKHIHVFSAHEIATINWLIEYYQSPNFWKRLPKLDIEHPVENRDLLERIWFSPVFSNNATIIKIENKALIFQERILSASFLLLISALLLMSLLVIYPSLRKLIESEQHAINRNQIQSELAKFSNEILSKDFAKKIRSRPLAELLKSTIKSYPGLAGVEISRADGRLSEGRARQIEFDIKLSDELKAFSTEIKENFKNLKSHIEARIQTQLRMEMETERDRYFFFSQSVISSLPIPVCLADEENYIQFQNEAFKSLYDMPQSSEPITLEDFANQYSEAVAKSSRKEHRKFFDKREAHTTTLRYKADQLFHWITQEIEGIGIIFLAQEITEIQREFDNKAHKNQLEELGKLSGTIAHDMNNLLAIISASLEAVQLHDLNSEQEELINTSLNQCESAAVINRQLLSYTQKQHLIPEAIYANEITKFAQTYFNSSKGNPHRLIIKMDCDAIGFADPNHLYNAISNLIKNAIEAMSEPADVCFEILRSASGNLQIIVEDKGPGYPQKLLDEGIKPFQTTKKKGNGLGLASVKGFASQSGGTLTISNKADGGARTVLEIPLAKSLPLLKEKRKVLPLPGAQRSLNIYVLEDTSHLNRALSHYLRRQGYEVKSFTSNPELLEAIKQPEEKVDILLTDIILANELSFDVIPYFLEKHPNCKIIYMTGFGTSNFSKFFQKWPGEILEKPFRLDELNLCLRRETQTQRRPVKKPHLRIM